MILQAVSSMPQADKWVFVVREEHLQEKEVISALKSVSKNVTILVDPHPIGQLNSCLVARDFYDNEEPLFVGACDLGLVWNQKEYNALTNFKKKDSPTMIVWSFTKQPNLARNPQAWGWLKQDQNNNIHGVSVKVPISNNPFNDYAITGSFTFRSGKEFLKIAEELMRCGVTVKGEYYIDSMIGIALEMGYNVASFPVKKYIGWGTPADYEEYCYWEKAINQSLTEAKSKQEYEFWREYFQNGPH